MPISSIFVGVALALLVVPFVAGPLVKTNGRRRPAQAEEGAVTPEAAKQQALAALRDLDFDYRTGKVAEEDYTPLRQRLLVEAAEAAQAEQPAQEDEIEAAVRAIRAKHSTRACPECHASVSPSDRFCPKCGAALALTCPACQTVVQATDQFCAHCGKTLKPEAVPVS